LGTSSVLIPLMLSGVLLESVGELGLLTSSVSLAGVLGSLVWGRLSDASYRRKPFVVMSYLLVGACLAGIAISTSFVQLLILNTVLNFFWVANASVTVLLVIENGKKIDWERKIGRLNQYGAIGWFCGLALGTAAMALGMPALGSDLAIRALFVAIAVAGVGAGLIAARRIPRTRPVFVQRRFRGMALAMGNFLIERARYAPLHLYHRFRPRRIWRALAHPRGFERGTKRFLGATVLAFIGLGLFGIPLPLLLAEHFGFAPSIVFFLFMIQHAGIVIAYPLAARRIHRRGNRRIQAGALGIRFALFFAAAVYLALTPRVPHPAVLVGAFLVYGVTWSFFQLSGIALTTRLAKPENKGLALGLYNALAGVGWIVAGVMSGVIAQHVGYAACFGCSVLFLGLSLAVLRKVPAVAQDPAEAVARSADRHPAHAA
jgi:MFS family permease